MCVCGCMDMCMDSAMQVFVAANEATASLHCIYCLPRFRSPFPSLSLFSSLSSSLPSIATLPPSHLAALCVGVRLLACACHSSVVFCLPLPLGVCLIFKYGKQPRLPYAHSRRQHDVADDDDDHVAIKANKERIIYCSQFKVASMMQAPMNPKRGTNWVPGTSCLIQLNPTQNTLPFTLSLSSVSLSLLLA